MQRQTLAQKRAVTETRVGNALLTHQLKRIRNTPAAVFLFKTVYNHGPARIEYMIVYGDGSIWQGSENENHQYPAYPINVPTYSSRVIAMDPSDYARDKSPLAVLQESKRLGLLHPSVDTTPIINAWFNG